MYNLHKYMYILHLIWACSCGKFRLRYIHIYIRIYIYIYIMLFYYRLTGFMYINLQSLYKNVRLVNLMARERSVLSLYIYIFLYTYVHKLLYYLPSWRNGT